MLNLLIDTSTWLDLAKRRDGQRLIVPLRVFSHQNKVNLLVPSVRQPTTYRLHPNVPKSTSAPSPKVPQQLRVLSRGSIKQSLRDEEDTDNPRGRGTAARR